MRQPFRFRGMVVVGIPPMPRGTSKGYWLAAVALVMAPGILVGLALVIRAMR